MSALPELDSVVRFEGEITAEELLQNVDLPQNWPAIQGLVFRRGSEIVINPARPLVDDLDSLPWPARGDTLQAVRGIPMAPMLASRGCLFNCSFCSIRQFYGEAPGPHRRIRSPEDVVAEMRSLYDSRGVRLFLFQDDDFAAKTEPQRAWVERFLLALDAEGLTGKVGWKISCRVDDIEAEIMARCRDRGLLAAYLGVESGNGEGLATLNKHATVEQNLQAMRTLRRIGVEFDMGFMLLDPGTTFASIRENVAFLRKVAELGGPPISFVARLQFPGPSLGLLRAVDHASVHQSEFLPGRAYRDSSHGLFRSPGCTGVRGRTGSVGVRPRDSIVDRSCERQRTGDAGAVARFGRALPRRRERGAELARAEPDRGPRRGGASRDIRAA
jgi:radical SAM superfamily enzyme YgiQ (UPF0313 family)